MPRKRGTPISSAHSLKGDFMEFGLFTCGYQHLPLETAFYDAKAFGYDYIELWGGRPHAFASDLLAGDACALTI